MKMMLRSLILVPVVLFVFCGAIDRFAGVGPADPIFPATNSIIPLQKYNQWVFSYTAYDTLGKKIIPHALDYHLSIGTQYGLVNDTTLVLLNNFNYYDTFPGYAYAYEKESQGTGYIVVYRSHYPLETRGLYLVGEYDMTSMRLYPKEQLWLSYPGDSGKTWGFRPHPLGDSSLVFSMEVMSTHAPFYQLDSGSALGVKVHDSCYLYRQTCDDTIVYYYYNEKVGNLGYQRFEAGKLRTTLILKSFTNNNRNLPD